MNICGWAIKHIKNVFDLDLGFQKLPEKALRSMVIPIAERMTEQLF